MVLTFAICMQFNTVSEMMNEIGSPLRDNNNLRDEYVRWKAMQSDISKELTKLEKDLENIRSVASADDADAAKAEAEIKVNERLLGLTEVEGSGIRIVLDDNRTVTANEVINISEYIVHEGDILSIVNELFNSGADAIAINGHRIINASSIYCDGNIVRINNEKTGVPLTIDAIRISSRDGWCYKKTRWIC